MASRATRLLTAIVDALQQKSDADNFADFQPDVVKSYGHAWTLESLTDHPTVYVRIVGKTAAPASRIQYRQEITVGMEIVAAIPTTSETNDGGAVLNLETFCNFVDEIERVMREDCKLLEDCTLTVIESDPLYSEATQEEMNVFQSLTTFTYIITEQNTL